MHLRLLLIQYDRKEITLIPSFSYFSLHMPYDCMRLILYRVNLYKITNVNYLCDLYRVSQNNRQIFHGQVERAKLNQKVLF